MVSVGNSIQCIVCTNMIHRHSVVCVVTCRGLLTVSGVDDVTGQSMKLI